MRISDWSSDVCSSDLVARRGVARGFAGEFGLLELGISGHPAILIATRQLEHAVVELVEARERDELEFVSHRAQLALELGDVVAIEIGFPIEARRTIVGEQLVREFLADRLGEARSEERRVGTECVSTWRSGWSPEH